ALVFCSAPDPDCKLVGAAKSRLCPWDRIPGVDRPGRPGILAAIEKRECMGLRPRPSIRVDRPLAKALTRVIKQAGVRESRRKRRLGDCLLKEILSERPGWQDWSAALTSMPDVERRIRVYLVGKAAAAGEMRTIQRAGEREFQLLEILEHPGILRALVGNHSLWRQEKRLPRRGEPPGDGGAHGASDLGR
ncbi:MAG: hypothetical protein GY859_44480, partial [Desulfobacterales bacterium]|nr:hypothetical protein [Desulfobacterales bacterium]